MAIILHNFGDSSITTRSPTSPTTHQSKHHHPQQPRTKQLLSLIALVAAAIVPCGACSGEKTISRIMVATVPVPDVLGTLGLCDTKYLVQQKQNVEGCPPAWRRVPGDGALRCSPDYPVWGVGPALPTGFTVHDTGSVAHTLTGLTWQQIAADTGGLSWAEAMEMCRGLKLSGHSDWRLPTAAELLSIVELGPKGMFSPSAESPFLPKPAISDPLWKGFYWSASTDAASQQTAWTIRTFGPSTTTKLRSDVGSARCVRGATPAPQPVPRFEIDYSMIAVDKSSGLTWERCPSSAKFTISDAAKRCKVNFAGLPGKGWRLPTIRELSALIYRGSSSPAFDAQVFSWPEPDSRLGVWADAEYWSSTPGLDLDDGSVFEGEYYVVTGRDGAIYTKCVTPDVGCPHTALVRCVR